MLSTPTQPTPLTQAQINANQANPAYAVYPAVDHVTNQAVNQAGNPAYPAGYSANDSRYPNNPAHPNDPRHSNNPAYPAFASLVPTPEQQDQARYLTELLNTTAATVASVVKRMDQATRGDQETLDLILTELRGLQASRAAYLGQAEAEKAARDKQAIQDRQAAPASTDARPHNWTTPDVHPEPTPFVPPVSHVAGS